METGNDQHRIKGHFDIFFEILINLVILDIYICSFEISYKIHIFP